MRLSGTQPSLANRLPPRPGGPFPPPAGPFRDAFPPPMHMRSGGPFPPMHSAMGSGGNLGPRATMAGPMPGAPLGMNGRPYMGTMGAMGAMGATGSFGSGVLPPRGGAFHHNRGSSMAPRGTTRLPAAPPMRGSIGPPMGSPIGGSMGGPMGGHMGGPMGGSMGPPPIGGAPMGSLPMLPPMGPPIGPPMGQSLGFQSGAPSGSTGRDLGASGQGSWEGRPGPGVAEFPRGKSGHNPPEAPSR